MVLNYNFISMNFPIMDSTNSHKKKVNRHENISWDSVLAVSHLLEVEIGIKAS